MQRKIVVDIQGEIHELLACWTPPRDIKVKVTEPEKNLRMVFLN